MVTVPHNIESKAGKRGKHISMVLGVFGVFLIILFLAPVIWTKVHPVKSLEVDTTLMTATARDISYQPEVDLTLPIGNVIKIPSIGVNSQIFEGANGDYEQELRQGVWRVNDFGTSFNRVQPMILVAHRFGYFGWSNAFRHTNSFYNLPNVKNGDIVEVNWNQRKYIYAIYGESEGDEIADYGADLILYTCQDISSSVRVFRYARLIKL